MQKILFSLSIFFIIILTVTYTEFAQTQESIISKLKVNSQSFTFELEQCGKLNTGIACDFLITNNGTARELNLFLGESKIIGVDDHNYIASSIQYVGASRVTYNKGVGVRRIVGSGETTSGRVTFSNILQPIDRIASLKIAGRVFDYEINVIFQNITLTHLGRKGSSISHNANRGLFPTPPVLPYSGRGSEKTFTISRINQWLDTGIKIEPGLRLVISANGTITMRNLRPVAPDPTGIDLIIRKRLKTERVVGTKDLHYKIAYKLGGESKPIKVVGSKYAIEPDRVGVLFLGVIQPYYGDTNGSISVLVQW